MIALDTPALDEALALPRRFVIPTASHVRFAFALRDRICVVDGLYMARSATAGLPSCSADSTGHDARRCGGCHGMTLRPWAAHARMTCSTGAGNNRTSGMAATWPGSLTLVA